MFWGKSSHTFHTAKMSKSKRHLNMTVLLRYRKPQEVYHPRRSHYILSLSCPRRRRGKPYPVQGRGYLLSCPVNCKNSWKVPGVPLVLSRGPLNFPPPPRPDQWQDNHRTRGTPWIGRGTGPWTGPGIPLSLWTDKQTESISLRIPWYYMYLCGQQELRRYKNVPMLAIF